MPRKKEEPIFTLQEKADRSLISRLLGSEKLTDEQKEALYKYQKKIKGGYATVNYHYAKKNLGKGRVFAEGGISLQSFKKSIRHAIAKENYNDIDMVNAHPTLLMQYCKKNEITCEKLTDYVKNRDEWLAKIMKYHEITRDAAKKLILRICYLGAYELEEGPPPKKMKRVCDLSTELKIIAKKICTIETETYEFVKNDETKENIRSSVMSKTAEILEDMCLREIKKFFERKKYKVGVLCFDGLMIEKEDKDDQISKKILNKCSKYVFEKTGYDIKLDIKEMDQGMEIPQFGVFVNDDKDVQEKLFKLENPNYFKYCDKILYVFNEKTGQYDKNKKGDEDTLYYYITKHQQYFKYETSLNPDWSKIKSYGRDTTLMKKVPEYVRIEARDDKWVEKTSLTSLGYLLFKNGIYDFNTGKFTKGFNHEIVFHHQVPHKFPERNEKYIEYAKKLSFDTMFENPQPIMVALARALAGDIEAKKFYFCPGMTNAGKSTLVTIFSNVFGTYVQPFNAENLAYRENTQGQDEAAKNRWMYLLRYARIIFSNEVNMKKTLNGNDIKKIASGGDSIIGRNHYESEINFVPHFTAFCMLNDIPKIEPVDDAVEGRLVYCEFGKQFVTNPTLPHHVKKDPQMKEKIKKKKFIRGFIHLMLDSYKYYLKHGQPEFDEEIKEEWLQGDKSDLIVSRLIRDNYVITQDLNDTVSVSELSKFKEQHKKEFETMSLKRFNEIIKNMGATQGRKGKNRERVWQGIKSIDNIDY